jgi:hypothetical protein
MYAKKGREEAFFVSECPSVFFAAQKRSELRVGLFGCGCNADGEMKNSPRVVFGHVKRKFLNEKYICMCT